MDQFAQMRTLLSSFLGPKQETIRTAFCNSLASEVEALENRDFQTFRNESVELLISIQSRGEERNCQPQQPQHKYRATSAFVPQTFQQPQQPSVHRESILTIPENQITASQCIQPIQQSQVATKGQLQQSRGQPTSFLVVDDHQVAPSRSFTFALTPMKQFNPQSVTSVTSKKSTKISGLSSFFGDLQFVMSYQQIDTLQPFLPPDPQ